jgi:EAL domain-containing protein (putative c-di-GMP-specific phosphodiesterase class I)
VVSVNVSAVQLRFPGFAATVHRALEASGLEASALVLELTESTMIDDSAGVQETLRAVRAMGVRIAVDDFGTGWSSLGTLASLPVDMIKLDRSFVARMEESPAHEALIGGVLSMAAAIGLATVVEGVETEAQLQRLRALGARVAQGFHLGRPGPLPPLASGRCASSRSTAAGSVA